MSESGVNETDNLTSSDAKPVDHFGGGESKRLTKEDRERIIKTYRDDTNRNPIEVKKPQLSWVLFVIHYACALIISFLIKSLISADPNATVLTAYVDTVSTIIPSIRGGAAISNEYLWAEIFLLFCWAGAPFHLWYMWRTIHVDMHKLAYLYSTGRFWFYNLGSFALCFMFLFVPEYGHLPDDATQSLRRDAHIVSIIKENFLAFSCIGMLWVFSFSAIFVVTTKNMYYKLKICWKGN